MFKTLGLADHENVFEVDRLGRRRRRRHVARLLCDRLATWNQQLGTDQSQGKAEKHPKRAHLNSLQTLKDLDDAGLAYFSLGEKFIEDWPQTQFFRDQSPEGIEKKSRNQD